jgi:hypothetical protein
MVLRVQDVPLTDLVALLSAYGVTVRLLAPDTAIPGSYWGESEAGLIGSTLFARADTPVHSVLHEASHYICAAPDRRRALDRDAGGDDAEECAVCYLQLLLADRLAPVGMRRLMQDMDEWGYSFRLGSTDAWFRHDAADARAWLQQHGVVDDGAALSGRLRC